ncbi:MAG: trigger factor [Gemmatimonadota bacterium]
MAVDQTSRNPGIEVSLVEGQGWLRTLTVTVSTDRVARTRAAEAGRVSRNRRVKGFRKGKIPAAVVEQRFGAEIDERVQQRLLDEAYREALDQEDLTPAGPGRITDVKYGPAEPFVFQAELEVMPSVRLDRLGGFKIERSTDEVTEDEVREILDRIREENADWIGIDRQPETGDRVSVRIAPLTGDEDQPAGNGTAYQLVLGAGQALEDVEKAISTLGPGDDGIFEVDFPDESEAEEEAPVTRRLHIRLESVEERELPELNDQLAAVVGPFETVADLEATVREDLERHHENEAESRLRTELIAAVVDANPFVVPAALIDRYLASMLQAPDDTDPAELERMREAIMPHAERQIREQLVLDRIIDREGFEPTPEEIEAEIADMAARRSVHPGKLRRELARDGSLESLGRNLAVEKAFGYLKDQSGIS